MDIVERAECKAPGRPDMEADCHRLWDVLSAGGIAIVLSHVGYALWGTTADATRRINEGKGRGTHKRQGMMMGRDRGHHFVGTRLRSGSPLRGDNQRSGEPRARSSMILKGMS